MRHNACLSNVMKQIRTTTKSQSRRYMFLAACYHASADMQEHYPRT